MHEVYVTQLAECVLRELVVNASTDAALMKEATAVVNCPVDCDCMSFDCHKVRDGQDPTELHTALASTPGDTVVAANFVTQPSCPK